MAKRRRIGAALMGAAEGLSPLIQMLGRQQQADQAHKQQLQERAFQAQLQQELADRQGQLQLIQQGLKDPGQFNRLVEGGQTELAGMDISKLGVSPDQAMGAAAGDIAKVSKLEDLPTDLDIEMSNKGRPGFNAKDPTSIEMLMAQRNAREGQLTSEAMLATTPVQSVGPDGSKTTTYQPTRTLAGTSVQTELPSVEKAKLEGQGELTKMQITGDEDFRQKMRLENAKAARQLADQKALIDYKLAAEGNAAGMKMNAELTRGATEAILGLEELGTLALEVNKDYNEGMIDTYAGAKNAIAQLPYVGQTLSGLMTSTSAQLDSLIAKDPTIPRKANQLEAMRWQMGIKLIRAAGDPRPSNADVQGVIGMIPGSYESRQSTEQKVGFMRDMVTMLPEVMAQNPGLTGKALLDVATTEAQKRSDARQVQPAPPQPTNGGPIRLKMGPDGKLQRF